MNKFRILKDQKHQSLKLYLALMWNQRLKKDRSRCSYQPKLNQSWVNSEKKVKIMSVTCLSQMSLCCTNPVLMINGQLYLKFQCFDWMLLLQTVTWEKIEPCVEYLLHKNVNINEAKLFDHIKTSTNLWKISLKHIQRCISKWWHMRDGLYFKTCNTIEFFSEQLKIAQFYFSLIKIINI